MVPLELAAFGTPTLAEIGWAVVLGAAAAVVTFPVRVLGRRVAGLVSRREYVVVPAAGLAVAALAFGYAQLTDRSANLVLFSGQEALPELVSNADDFTVAALMLLMLGKGLAWGVSLGAFRGGPTFPAMFIGAAGGIAAAHLPGLPDSASVPVAMGAMIVAVLRLPLSAIVIASLLCTSAGVGVAPLVIVAVVTAHLATLVFEGRLRSSTPDGRGTNGTAMP
jgi:hypothetical protein